jgi:uncharacterized protein YbaP (TraB family)
MKIRVLGFLGLIFCFLVRTGFAQVPSENALLWEISKPGQAKPSYLFGTIHLICPADFVLSDSLKSAVTKSGQIALEMDMDDPGMMMTMMKSMNMKDGVELKSLITESEYNQLNRFYTDSVGMGLAMLEKAKPFVLMGPLFHAVLACQPQSYEMTLVELAQKQNMEVVGLEALEEQMAIFDSIPYKEQAKIIISLINDRPKARKEFEEMVALYKRQNISALYDLTMKSEYGLEGNAEIMLFDRNKKWIPRIQKMIGEKPTFFAVGAAHLGGEKGVIALLREQGFKVRPVL